jgi:hypothetical protein
MERHMLLESRWLEYLRQMTMEPMNSPVSRGEQRKKGRQVTATRNVPPVTHVDKKLTVFSIYLSNTLNMLSFFWDCSLQKWSLAY